MRVGLPLLFQILALLHALSSVVKGEGLGLAGVGGMGICSMYVMCQVICRGSCLLSPSQLQCMGGRSSPAFSGLSAVYVLPTVYIL